MDERNVSRRQAVGLVGVGLASAAGGVLAQQQTPPSGMGRFTGVVAIWTPLQISGGASVMKYTHFGNTTALGRPGQPAELASIYVQLAASDASFTTGNIYGAGGGEGQP